MILKLKERIFPDFYTEEDIWCECKIEGKAYIDKEDWYERYAFCSKCHNIVQTH